MLFLMLDTTELAAVWLVLAWFCIMPDENTKKNPNIILGESTHVLM